jgi:glyoxylase-like metal-dependent hydrolase (beta-lactamase superfamily II)
MPRTALTVPILLIAALAAAQEHHDRAPSDPFTLKPLSGNVYALYGRGGNVGFYVGPDAVVVVDSQFKDLAPGIVDKIKSVTDKPIKYLVNTHHHGDHVGGNEVFRHFAVIIGHDNVRTRMLASPGEILRDFPARVAAARKAGNEAQAKQLSEQIESARNVKVEKANVLHMGDDFFNKVIPFIDVAHGGSVKGYLVALDKVVGRVPANVTIIPGHGEVTEVFVKQVDIAAYKDYPGYADRFKSNAAAAWDEAP